MAEANGVNPKAIYVLILSEKFHRARTCKKLSCRCNKLCFSQLFVEQRLDEKAKTAYIVYRRKYIYLHFTWRVTTMQSLERVFPIFDFNINLNSKEAIYEQIIFQIKLLIANEKLKIGDSIPSMRKFAKRLSVSTISIQRAYTELQKDGIIECYEGKGSFIAAGVSKSSLKDYLLREVEEETKRNIKIAKQNGVTLQELQELLKILWDEKD